MSTANSGKVAVVIQRYGKDVVGGAEAHARILAEKLKKSLGYEVEVYTTTAKDYTTWSNEYDEGVEYLDGIKVHRFPVRKPRARFFGFYDRLIRKVIYYLNKVSAPRWMTRTLEWIWIDLQGPVCPKLVAELNHNSSQYQKIIFFCYLYYPTLVGSRGLEQKSILIPLAHDEPPFHFQIVKDLLRRIPRMIPNTEPEWEMIKTKLDQGQLPLSTPAGLGFEQVMQTDEAVVSSTIKSMAAKGPYLLYLGRISAGKGVHELVQWFSSWRHKNKNYDLRLLLAGHRENSVAIPDSASIEYLGFVSDDERDFLIKECKAMVNPSIYESLSMIVIESLVAGKPVLARRQCEVFRFYASVAPMVKLVGNAEEFSQEVANLMTRDPESILRGVEISKNWATKRFSWESILKTFKLQIES